MILIYALGAELNWNIVAYAGIIFPILGFVLLINSPESPFYLISKGEAEKAKDSLKKLTTLNNVSKELEKILKDTKILKETPSGNESSWHYIKNIQNYPNVYKPFLIVSLLRWDCFYVNKTKSFRLNFLLQGEIN